MNEEDIVKALEADNAEYIALRDEHRDLKAKLAEFKTKVYLTPEEELEKKNLQKKKLSKKDRMAEIIQEYKTAHA